MTEKRLPWSWLALAASCLAFGLVEVGGIYFISPFRHGLEADTVPWLWQATVADVAVMVGLVTLFGAPWIVVARWAANRTGRPRRAFTLLLVAVPTTLLFAKQLWWIISEALEPPSPLIPFESDSLWYLPNWLNLAFCALSFLTSAQLYTALADRRAKAIA